MFNRHCYLAGIISLALIQGIVAQPSSPLQNRTIETPYDLVFDNKAWSFNTGMPVRSTVLVLQDYLYFGNAAGEFFALHKKTGQVKWTFRAGQAIHSSAAAAHGRIFFADNRQTLYCLDQVSGKKIWTFNMGPKKAYPWRFDYFYSSPCLYQDDLLIGGDDGFIYRLNQQSGKLIWKFAAKGLVRTTPYLYKNSVLFGDTEATFYSLDARSGKKRWEFRIVGDSIDDYKYGYDKRAIVAGANSSGNLVFFGARDAHLYCLNAEDGSFRWTISHEPSWICSTVAIKDSFVITGTSDGRFVQALNRETGREIWKHKTALAVWASPLINNQRVYTGGYDGQLLCLDLKTGNRISQFCTNGIIFSSPVINDSLLYVGSDDGYLYALQGRKKEPANPGLRRFVYYDNSMPVYFRGGAETRVKNYLATNDFTVIGTDTLASLFSQLPDAKNTVVVADGFYFPRKLVTGNEQSILRHYLEAGGRLVLIGNNPLFYELDEKTKDVNFNIPLADSVLGIHYGENDTRAFGGLYPASPTVQGKRVGLPGSWVSNFGVDAREIDIALGKNENGQASAFVKKYKNGGCLLQIWINENLPMNLDAIIKVSEENW